MWLGIGIGVQSVVKVKYSVLLLVSLLCFRFIWTNLQVCSRILGIA